MKLYMFRTVHLSIIRSLFTVHSAMVCVIQVCRQLLSRTRYCSKAVYRPVWHIPLLSVQWINSWWWTDELSETCRVSWQNKFLKLVHLVGFITKKKNSWVVQPKHLFDIILFYSVWYRILGCWTSHFHVLVPMLEVETNSECTEVLCVQ